MPILRWGNVAYWDRLLDLYSLFTSIEAVLDYLQKVDSEAAKRAREKERNAVLRKYDLGIVAVWATEDIQKVRETVEGLL